MSIIKTKDTIVSLLRNLVCFLAFIWPYLQNLHSSDGGNEWQNCHVTHKSDVVQIRAGSHPVALADRTAPAQQRLAVAEFPRGKLFRTRRMSTGRGDV